MWFELCIHVQSSVQVQRAVQRKPAFVQEHLPWHPFLHPHLTSSWHDFVTSGNVVQNGFQMPSPIVHPHSWGLGNTGLGTSACPQQCPAWYVARLACSTRAALVGGMAFRALYRKLFPVPNATQRSRCSPSVTCWRNATVRTRTSVSTLRKRIFLWPCCNASWTCSNILVSASSCEQGASQRQRGQDLLSVSWYNLLFHLERWGRLSQELEKFALVFVNA